MQEPFRKARGNPHRFLVKRTVMNQGFILDVQENHNPFRGRGIVLVDHQGPGTGAGLPVDRIHRVRNRIIPDPPEFKRVRQQEGFRRHVTDQLFQGLVKSGGVDQLREDVEIAVLREGTHHVHRVEQVLADKIRRTDRIVSPLQCLEREAPCDLLIKQNGEDIIFIVPVGSADILGAVEGNSGAALEFRVQEGKRKIVPVCDLFFHCPGSALMSGIVQEADPDRQTLIPEFLVQHPL